jgi:hypothetical protein
VGKLEGLFRRDDLVCQIFEVVIIQAKSVPLDAVVIADPSRVRFVPGSLDGMDHLIAHELDRGI